MNLIAIVAVLFCCFSMFFVKRETKVGIMILGAMLFSAVSVPAVPLHNANALIPLFCIISELRHFRSDIRFLNTSKTVRNLMILVLTMSILVILASPHLNNASEIRYYLQSDLLFKYFALAYAFLGFRGDENGVKPTLKLTFVGLIILTIFGVGNFITKSSDFINAVTAGSVNEMMDPNVGMGSVYAERDRFRVQSMFTNPFDYGFMCALMLLLHLYGYNSRLENRKTFIVAGVCCLFGIITCGCRTILICTIIGICVYVLAAFKMGRKIQIAFCAIFLMVISYVYVPFLQEQFDFMMSAFDENSNVGGSSLEMRGIQYAAVLDHIQDDPLFGCGYGYFTRDLGWGEGREYLRDPRLAGLEGVFMNYLLERGVVGLLFYLCFYITLFVYCLRNRKNSQLIAALGISVVATYFCFANMTGELKSVYPTLLLMGYVIRMISNNVVSRHDIGDNIKTICPIPQQRLTLK